MAASSEVVPNPEYTLRDAVPTLEESTVAVTRIISKVSVPLSTMAYAQYLLPQHSAGVPRASPYLKRTLPPCQGDTATPAWENALDKLCEDFDKESRDLAKLAKQQVMESVRRPPRPRSSCAVLVRGAIKRSSNVKEGQGVPRH